MSVIIASGEKISKSPTNNSTAKQMFSFPKSDRFPKKKNSSEGAKFYDLPTSLTKRSTSFGKGTKYDFTRENRGKCDKFYNIYSDFDPKHSASPKYSFGVSRSFYEKVYIESSKLIDKNIPGPGKYDATKPFGKDALKFSLIGKGKSIDHSSKIPGPGTYNQIGLNTSGKYPISSFQNLRTVKFGGNDEKRFKYEFSKNPGPSDYDIKNLINGKGVNFISKYHNAPAPSMSPRLKDISRNNIPGPGSYLAPSEFGIYESKFASQNASMHELSKSILN